MQLLDLADLCSSPREVLLVECRYDSVWSWIMRMRWENYYDVDIYDPGFGLCDS